MSSISAVSYAVQPISRPQRVTGKIASPKDPRAIQTVRLADGREGFRVGPLGMIFADRNAAIRFATVREGRLARIGGVS